MLIALIKYLGSNYLAHIFAAHLQELPDSIRVVQLILVQYVLVRIQVGQRKGKMKVFPFFYWLLLKIVVGEATNNGSNQTLKEETIFNIKLHIVLTIF